MGNHLLGTNKGPLDTTWGWEADGKADFLPVAC